MTPPLLPRFPRGAGFMSVVLGKICHILGVFFPQ